MIESSIYIIVGLIIIIIIGTTCIFALPWKKIFINKWGDNPEKCIVFIKCGDHRITSKGYQIGTTTKEDGRTYSFKINKQEYQVNTLKNYPYVYQDGRREIYLVEGEACAYWPKDYDSDNEYHATEALFNSHVHDRALKSGLDHIHGSNTGLTKIIVIALIVIILAAGAFFVFKSCNKTDTPIEQTTTQNTITTTRPLTPITTPIK